MNFLSDNTAGVAPEITEAIVEASRGFATGYGADDYSKRALAALAEVFETELEAFLVPTGTAANALALGAVVRPFDAIFCHEEAHIHDDECGAPEFFTGGAKLVGIAGVNGKITAEALDETLARYPRGIVRAVQPGALSISQVTEAGTLYSLQELGALADVARRAGLSVHMDGARFANAVVAAGVSPAEMTWRLGIDVLSFGASKNGALASEAVVFFDRAKAADFAFLRKRAGHTLSKGRFLGAQMAAYLKDGLWLDLALRANRAAARLAAGLISTPGVRAAWPTDANEAFVIAPDAILAEWRAAGAKFYDWSTRAIPASQAPVAGESVIRLVTSFETSDAEVDAMIDLAKRVRMPT